MDGVLKHRWQWVLFIGVLVGLTTAIFYGAYHGPWDPRLRNRWDRMATLNRPAPLAIQGDKITLLLGQALQLPKIKLIYQGLDKNQIHLAVYLMELDPEVAYMHQIPISKAKRGFRLGDQKMVLLSHSKQRLTLRISEQP